MKNDFKAYSPRAASGEPHPSLMGGLEESGKSHVMTATADQLQVVMVRTPIKQTTLPNKTTGVNKNACLSFGQVNANDLDTLAVCD